MLGLMVRKAQADGTLEVSDTRLGASRLDINSWYGSICSKDNQLNGSTLNLASTGSLGEDLATAIKDDASAVEVVKGNRLPMVFDTFNMAAADSKLTMS